MGTFSAMVAAADERATGGVHLVGSLPLGGAEQVFEEMSAALGDRLERLPDGETGPRADWIVWQYPVFSSHPEFVVCPPGANPYQLLPRLRLRVPDSIDTLRFFDLGYAQAALASYATFARMKDEGTIPGHVRFQVSFPTPVAPITAFIVPADQARVEPVYEAAILDEVRQICDAVPHDQLAIQWDANFEFAMLGGLIPCWFDDARAGIIERLSRLAASVPADVEVGFHFCQDHQRLRHDRPYDARHMVDIANAVSATMTRPMNWLHLPVPEDRLDVAFFEKLGPLILGSATELYLGLIHVDQGELGVNARITAARRFLSNFGVATACGWGRSAHGDIEELVKLHIDASTPLPAA